MQQSNLFAPVLPSAAGAGRRVGENCGHLWAEIKPITQLTRYMAKPNYLDCIDGGLTYVAESKLRDFATTMIIQEKQARKKLGELAVSNSTQVCNCLSLVFMTY